MATTVSRFAAFAADIIPESIPIIIQSSTVNAINGNEINTGKFSGPDKIKVSM